MKTAPVKTIQSLEKEVIEIIGNMQDIAQTVLDNPLNDLAYKAGYLSAVRDTLTLMENL